MSSRPPLTGQRHRISLTGVGVIALLAGVVCGTPFEVAVATKPRTPAASKPRVYWPGATWKTAKPFAVGLDAARLAALTKFAEDNKSTSLMVIRNGYVVTEAYFSDNTKDTWNGYSIAKSMLSMAVGVAIDRKKLHLTDKVTDWFPAAPGQWRDVTVEHLLTMRSGIDINNGDQYKDMRKSENWGEFVLQRPFERAPGTWWRYKADPQVLSNILTAATGVSASRYLERNILRPIGFKGPVKWGSDATGHSNGSGGFYSTTENFARCGYLMLRNGVWKDKRLLSRAWVEAVSSPSRQPKLTRIDLWGANGRSAVAVRPLEYGYLWWARKFPGSKRPTPKDAYYAFGSLGQFIIVIPSMDLVVVRTGVGPEHSDETFLEQFQEHIAALPTK